MRELAARAAEEAFMTLGRVLIVALWAAEGVRQARGMVSSWR